MGSTSTAVANAPNRTPERSRIPGGGVPRGCRLSWGEHRHRISGRPRATIRQGGNWRSRAAHTLRAARDEFRGERFMVPPPAGKRLKSHRLRTESVRCEVCGGFVGYCVSPWNRSRRQQVSDLAIASGGLGRAIRKVDRSSHRLAWFPRVGFPRLVLRDPTGLIPIPLPARRPRRDPLQRFSGRQTADCLCDRSGSSQDRNRHETH